MRCNVNFQVVNYPNKFFIMKGEIDAEANMNAAREEREWREWVDNWFIHLISPNVYRNWSESLETFRWFEQVGDWHRAFPAWERILAVYVGAAAMFFLSKTLKKKYVQQLYRKFMDDLSGTTSPMNGKN